MRCEGIIFLDLNIEHVFDVITHHIEKMKGGVKKEERHIETCDTHWRFFSSFSPTHMFGIPKHLPKKPNSLV
jgi:hypothetical protein